jgi:hypothetical protein
MAKGNRIWVGKNDRWSATFESPITTTNFYDCNLSGTNSQTAGIWNGKGITSWSNAEINFSDWITGSNGGFYLTPGYIWTLGFTLSTYDGDDVGFNEQYIGWEFSHGAIRYCNTRQLRNMATTVNWNGYIGSNFTFLSSSSAVILRVLGEFYKLSDKHIDFTLINHGKG